MDEKQQQKAQILCLQKNLSAIRKIAGWTMEELGEKIGVTKQTISNLENFKTPLTLTQYIAIRSIIDYEIMTNKQNTVLPQVVDILLNKFDEYTEQEQTQISEKIYTVAATSAGGITGASLLAVAVGILGAYMITATPRMDPLQSNIQWISKLLKEENKNRRR